MKRHDDDQPADKAWLNSVGFVDADFLGVVEAYNRIRTKTVSINRHSVLSINDLDVIYHPTRRQVRLICEAVGVALNDVEQEANA